MSDEHARVVVVELSLQLLKELLRLPKDTEIVRVVEDEKYIPRPFTIKLLLRSPDFEPVREGHVAPRGEIVAETERHVTHSRVQVWL